MGRVAFVCQHGAFRSRIAAAYFNAWAPAGWSAISAGVTPQSEPSTRVAPLLAGTDAEPFVDASDPRPLHAKDTDLAISIDADVPGTEHWALSATDGDELRDEIKGRVTDLLARISGDGAI